LRAICLIVSLAFLMPGLTAAAEPGADLAGSPAATGALAVSGSARAWEEAALDRLGLPRLTVTGPDGSIAVDFPPPTRPLAGSGSYVRVFFGHDRTDSSSSSMSITVNGTELVTVPLDDSTAMGSVLEVPVPVKVLTPAAPNRLMATFRLGAGASASLGQQSTLHYELSGAAASLAGYPYALISTDVDSRPWLSVVTPRAPSAVEFGQAMRLLADPARRSHERSLLPHLLTGGEVRTLEGPGILVGRPDRLPAIAEVLRAAGFERKGQSWLPPGATVAPDRDAGLVVASVSPVAHAPLIAVTGQTDAGVERAVDRLVTTPASHLNGDYQIVSGDSATSPTETDGLTPPGATLRVTGAGQHRLALGIPVPPIGSYGAAVVNVTVSTAGGASAPGTVVTVHVNGTTQYAGEVPAGATRQLHLRVPGTDLRPGYDGLVASLAAADHGTDGSWSASIDTSTPAFSYPIGGRQADLRLLPHPFFDDPRQPTSVVVANASPTLLEATAKTLMALGASSLAPRPRLAFDIGGERGPGSVRRVVAVGAPPGGGALRLDLGEAGSVLVPRPSTYSARGGWLAEVRLGGPAPAEVLWVGGRDASEVAAAADLLGSGGLNGATATVASGSAPFSAAPVTPIRSVPASLWFARVLTALVALALIAVVGIQIRQSWSHAH
jgi:hypothetical protein